MVPNGDILTFAGATVRIAITGPSVIFTVSRAPAVGGRSGLITVTEVQSGPRPVGRGRQRSRRGVLGSGLGTAGATSRNALYATFSPPAPEPGSEG